ncbi:gliding motility lipoprotein GldD [Flagellimonas aquimarina]|jgi:gliding motility-associated lipoprotein GldD|uniref:Gliding motility lipoprotein GldD n=1 Tax=Flagellimonas aquimarina TaxID=2201895 RepID=A0A316L2Q4_9FLAO|nr:gliding motility lipoprotein GldD [Allomuricauda koreensis]PWL40151.1 gliding motility lipoprotein GldD [Allomuricauda koreensis]
MKHNWILIIVVLALFVSCKDEVLPKPKAMLRLDYPNAEYKDLPADCSYTFDLNTLSEVKENKDCSLVLDYPMMKGSIYITYKPVKDNLNTLLTDAQKLSYEHVVKADNIVEQPFVNSSDGVYGMFYEVSGNAASQSQFYVTDSINHFVTGSLYFYAKPNYDSILPAAFYMQKDVRRIMETLRWKK